MRGRLRHVSAYVSTTIVCDSCGDSETGAPDVALAELRDAMRSDGWTWPMAGVAGAHIDRCGRCNGLRIAPAPLSSADALMAYVRSAQPV